MKVAIFGDSWAYGCYKKLPNFQEELVNGATLQQLFANEEIVADNYAIQGSSNVDTVDQVKKYGSYYDFLIVLQTDPVRQYINDQDNTLKIKNDVVLPLSSNFTELCEFTLRNFYSDLEKASNNTKTLLIGGCTKLSFNYIPDSFITLPQSWTEMIVSDFTDSYYYWTEPTLCLYDYSRKHFKWNSSLEDFFEIEKLILNKNYIWQTSDYFSWCHASESGLKVMFEKIKEIINDSSQTSN